MPPPAAPAAAAAAGAAGAGAGAGAGTGAGAGATGAGAKAVVSSLSKMTGSQWLQMILLIICVGGIGAILWLSSLMVGDTNNLNEVQKKMGIIVGVTFAIVLMLGIFTYLYIRSQPDMFVPIILFMMFVNMEISLIAVGGSVLQKIV